MFSNLEVHTENPNLLYERKSLKTGMDDISVKKKNVKKTRVIYAQGKIWSENAKIWPKNIERNSKYGPERWIYPPNIDKKC